MAGDHGTTKSIETFTIAKWNSDEDREAGKEPFEVTQTTVTTVVDSTGETVSIEQREEILKPECEATNEPQ